MKAKRFIAVILSIILTLAVFAPVASAAGTQDLPVIYVHGSTGEVYNKNGERTYPDNVEIGEVLSDTALMGPILAKLGISAVTGEWDLYADSLADMLIEFFSPSALDKNGEPFEGDRFCDYDFYFIADQWTEEKVKSRCKSSGYTLFDFEYAYDWRCDYFSHVDDLHELIKTVLKYTGKKQVNILGLCLGGGLVEAYLVKYGSEGLVNTYISWISGAGGMSFVDTAFSNSISVDPDVLERFVNYFFENDSRGRGIIDDTGILELLYSGVALVNQLKLLGYGTDVAEKFWFSFSNITMPKVLRASFATYPSYWELMSPEYFEKSKEFVFGGYEEEYAGLIEKIDTYYNEVSSHHKENFEKFHDEYGIKCEFVAHYGAYNIPVLVDADEPTDNLFSVKCQTMGATTGKYGEKLSDEYVENARLNGTDKYISPDRMIDMSTAAMPDNTWAINNANHESRNDCIYNMFTAIFRSVDEVTVNTFSQYPQYLVLDSETDTLTPMTEDNYKDDISLEEDNSKFAPIKKLIAFLKKLFSFITNLFKRNVTE